jgi:cyclophilin family peptidyl-prolyl cis-trans isomerase
MALIKGTKIMYKFFRFIAVIAAVAFSSLCLSQVTAPKVSLQTNVGEIIIELNTEAAPISTANFLGYVNERFYDGVIFHRVIKDFMIQAGGYRIEMELKPNSKAPIKNESDNGLKNLKYTVAMARTRVPDSATSQFFINHKDNAFLDGQAGKNGQPGRPGYAVFGKVVKGMDIVEKIANTQTKSSKQFANVPVKPISIIKAVEIKNSSTKTIEKQSPKAVPVSKPKI